MAVRLNYLAKLQLAIQRILLEIMTMELILLRSADSQAGYVLKNREILCHSCASTDYTKVWLGVLEDYLYRPKTFNIICGDPSETNHLGMYRACNGSCVTMEERKVVGGQFRCRAIRYSVSFDVDLFRTLALEIYFAP